MELRAQRSIILIFLILVINSAALHLQQSQNTQLQALKDKQQLLRDQVKALNANSADIQSKLQAAGSDEDRIQILQGALGDERQTIFDLKNKIISPFNESQTACSQLDDKQKQSILQKIKITKEQLNKLQEINNKLNQSSTQVQGVNDSIQKELILLSNLENILNTKCKQNLSPTIFQSNLNAKNWILGPQTMNDLEEEYAQRALIFHNITNCPLQTPFFVPQSETCTNCSDPNPLFNMYSKECTSCDNEEVLDQDNKVCKFKPHYTNFTKQKNWDLDGGNLPAVDKKLTPCPDAKPYYNGVVCVSCELPQYWSASANLCKTCPKDQAFDINTKKCQKILKNQLTILQNTNWISQNLTQVIENRTIALQKNKTAKNYVYCPQNTPYFDGTTCINCDYFDIDKLKCVSKPSEKQYNTNMRRFLSPQNQVQTDPNALRYISNTKLTDSDVPNCNSSSPYYDGMACIQCLKPFDIFNVDEKKCISCNNDEIFVSTTHKCDPRKRIRISQNFDRLLATPKVTVPQYKQSLIKAINDNPQAIVTPCKDSKHYSNLTDCFFCQDNEYFNVETLQCQICDGVYFSNNQTCKTKVYIFTNLKAPKILDMDGTTVEDENAKISEFLKTHSDSYVCPIDKPYAIENTTCGTCTDLFSYSELKCKQCSQWNIYVSDTKKCVQAKMIVNFTDYGKFLVNENETLASFKSQQQSVQNDNPNIWKICPGDRPYTDNREYCFSCSKDQPYFNYTLKQCQNCPDNFIFDKQTSRCLKQFYITLINSDTQPKMIGYDNYTLDDFKVEQDVNKQSNPFVLCNDSQPFGTDTGCVQCNEPTSYFDIREKKCSEVRYLINFQKMSPNYILPNDKNLDSYVSEEDNLRKSSSIITKKCPDNATYTSDRYSCFNCDQGKYFVFERKSCQTCPQGQSYVKQTKACQQLFYVSKITTNTEPNMKGYPNYTLDNYKKDQADIKAKNPYQQCPDSTPYGTDNECQQCSDPTPYFDIKKRVCSSAKKLINFATVGENYLVADKKTLDDYKTSENNFKLYSESLTVQCPPQTPFTSDRDSCFVCKDPDSLFNFQTKKCESCPHGSSFSNEKKQCLRLFYITNFNPDSQKMMVGTANYGIPEFQSDEKKNKANNPYQDCNETEPYGTFDGCKKCTLPEEYFDIKNKICTAVKKGINFDALDANYILGEGKSLSDYQKDEENFESSSVLPVISCPTETPFTSNHDDCIACQSPNIYFNLETKQCQNCEKNSAYDTNSKKCVKIIYYTLLDSTTEKNLLSSGGQTVSQYINDQQKLKSESGSTQCPSDSPFATPNGCIQCDSPTQYFNINSQTCQGCKQLYQYFEDNQCKDNAVLTNTKAMIGYFEVDNYTKYNVEKMNNFTYLNNPHVVDCPADKPFYSKDNVCIACDTSELPIFNLKDRTCMYVQSFAMSNPQAMKNYIESGDSTLEQLKNEIDVLTKRGVKLNICPANQPYWSQNQCITCPDTNKYFDLATQICRTCQPGQNCVSV